MNREIEQISVEIGELEKHTQVGQRLQAAVASLEREIENIRDNRSERLKWIEHFKRFSNIDELDRDVIIQLIKSIRVISKTNLDITFNYEYNRKTPSLCFWTEGRWCKWQGKAEKTQPFP